MIALTLAQLAHVLDGRLHLASGDTPDTVVSGGVDTDSRLIEPGGIFVAKPGDVTDGHLFVDAAVGERRGGGDRRARGRRIRHADRRGRRDRGPRRPGAARREDACGMPVTSASSGSPARTARPRPRTCSPASSRTRARPSRPRASFNNEVGAPLTMLRVTDDTRYLVSEFGASAPGEIARLAGLVQPDIGVVLMVGMAHAGGFGGIEATFACEVRAGAGDAPRRCGGAERRRPARGGDGAHRGGARGVGAVVRPRAGRRGARRRRRGHRRRHVLHGDDGQAVRRRDCTCACSASTTS